MYVCICNALRDKQLAELAATGAESVADVFRGCNARPQCGRCLPDIAEIIEDERANLMSSPQAAE